MDEEKLYPPEKEKGRHQNVKTGLTLCVITGYKNNSYQTFPYNSFAREIKKTQPHRN